MRKIPELLLFCLSCLLCFSLLFSFTIIDLCSAVQNPNTNGLRAWWSFEESGSLTPRDIVGGAEDSLCGNFEFVKGITGNALKFDGFGAYVKRNAKKITHFRQELLPLNHGSLWRHIHGRGVRLQSNQSFPKQDFFSA